MRDTLGIVERAYIINDGLVLKEGHLRRLLLTLQCVASNLGENSGFKEKKCGLQLIFTPL